MKKSVHIHVHDNRMLLRDAEPKWITVNGTHVEIKGGKVVKGPGALKKVNKGEVPFEKKIENRELANETREYANGFKEKTVSLADLHATQHKVNPKTVKEYASKPYDFEGHPVEVVKIKGKYHITEGHHTAAAALLRGETHIKVEHYS